MKILLTTNIKYLFYFILFFLFLSFFLDSARACTSSMRTSRPTTVITKLYSTSTGHRWASSNPFYPEFALGTLFELSSSNKVLEFSILLAKSLTNPILRTCHSIMIISPAHEAVMFPTYWATIIIQCLIILKNSRTPSSRTPGRHIISTFNILIKRKVIILIHEISIYISLDIIHSQVTFTILHWTFDLQDIRIYGRLDMLMYTRDMKDMLTPFNRCHLAKVNIHETNLTL